MMKGRSDRIAVETRVFKFGDYSLSTTLPKKFTSLLGIEPGDTIIIELDMKGNRIIIYQKELPLNKKIIRKIRKNLS